MRGYVIEPAATAIETGERGRHDATLFTPDDAEPGVTRRHRVERGVVIAGTITDAACAPERAKLVTVALAKVADLHRRPY